MKHWVGGAEGVFLFSNQAAVSWSGCGDEVHHSDVDGSVIKGYG